MKRRLFGLFLTLFMSASSLLVAAPAAAGDSFAVQKTAIDSPFRLAAPADAPPDCNAGPGFTWLICGVIRTIVGVIDWIRDNIIVPFLREKPLDRTDPEIKPVYDIWSAFRNVASVFFILIFFLIIFGTAIGWDSYTVKKVLPRLVAGAVLVPFSWYLCVIVIDIGNIVGQGLLALTSSVIPASTIDFTSSISKIFLGTAGILVVAAAATALATISLGVISTMLIGFLAVFFTLVLRKILIILCVIISPFALLAWILPNTEKWFKEWWTNFFKLIMMYPIVILLFEAGRLFAATAGATAGNRAETGVTPLFQLVGLTLPLFMVPFAFAWAGKGMKLGSSAIGKVSGGLDKRYGKDSAMAKERAEQRKLNNAHRALYGSNAVMRGLARKRSGLGGFVAAGGKLGKLPIIGQTAAEKQRLNAAEAKYSADRAQSQAQDEIRKALPQTSAQRIENQKAAAYDRLLDSRVAEAAAKKDPRTGLSIRETPLDPNGVKYLKEQVRTGTEDEKIAALQRLSMSQSGIKGIMELRTGKKIIQNDDGSFTYTDNDEHVGETWEDAARNPHEASAGFTYKGKTRAGMVNLKDRDFKNVDEDVKHIWDKGTANAKATDAKKPISAAATDMSASDVAGMSVHETRRYLEYYDRSIREQTAAIAASAPGSKERVEAEGKLAYAQRGAEQFNAAMKTALTTSTLRGQMLPEAINAVYQAGVAGNPGVHGATFQKAAENRVAPTAAAPGIASETSKQIVQAVGSDIVRASEIHQHIQNEVTATGTSTLQQNIQNKILRGEPVEAGDFAHVPSTGASSTMPSRVQEHLTRKLSDNIEQLTAAHREYEANEQYRRQVDQSVLNNQQPPAPPPRRPESP